MASESMTLGVVQRRILMGSLPILVGGAVGLYVLELSNPFFILVVLAGAAVTLGVILRPEWAMLGMVVMIYIRLSDVLVHSHGLPSVAKPFIFLLAFTILVRWVLFDERPRGLATGAALLAAYALIGFLGLTYAIDPGAVRDGLEASAKDAVVLFILLTHIQSFATLRRVVWAIILAGIFLGTIASLQYFTGTFGNDYLGFAQTQLSNIVSDTGGSAHRLQGPGLGPNGYGRVLLLVVPLAYERFWRERKTLLRVLAAWAFLVAVQAILLTYSRGAFLALVAVVGILLFRHRPKVSTLVAAGLALLLLMPFFPGQFTERMAELSKLLPGTSREAIAADVSLRGRASENIAAAQMFLAHPIMGVGVGNYNAHYQVYSQQLGLDARREDRSAHSIYLEILSELGLIGLTWFIIFQLYAFYGQLRARRDFRAANLPQGASLTEAVEVALIGFLVTGLFLHLSNPRFFWMLYGIALAVPRVARNELEAADARSQAVDE